MDGAPGRAGRISGMKIKVNVYGLDGFEARELEELISGLPEVHDVVTRYRASDHAIPLGEIRASASIPIAKFVIEFVGTVIATEIVKDVYKSAKEHLNARLGEWQEEKNQEREPKSRIHFTMLEDGEPIARLITREDRD